MIKQKSHIVIDAYMLQLGLKGNELLIYALIAGFCQDGVSECWTSQETMAEWCGGISTRAVRDILQNLITKKLITKKECLNKNGRTCHPERNKLLFYYTLSQWLP